MKNKTAHFIIARIAAAYELDSEDIMGSTKTKTIMESRLMCYWALCGFTSLSMSEVGVILNRDHTSVSSGCRRVTKLMRDPRYKAHVDGLMRTISESLSAAKSPEDRVVH